MKERKEEKQTEKKVEGKEKPRVRSTMKMNLYVIQIVPLSNVLAHFFF